MCKWDSKVMVKVLTGSGRYKVKNQKHIKIGILTDAAYNKVKRFKTALKGGQYPRITLKAVVSREEHRTRGFHEQVFGQNYGRTICPRGGHVSCHLCTCLQISPQRKTIGITTFSLKDKLRNCNVGKKKRREVLEVLM